jgi:hypothetical protein
MGLLSVSELAETASISGDAPHNWASDTVNEQCKLG